MSSYRRLSTLLSVGAMTAAAPLFVVGPAYAASCAEDNAELTLPSDFCATIFADTLGPVRHLAVAADGTVYVNSRRERDGGGSVPEGGYLIALRDKDSDGKAESVERFGGEGGTGLAIHQGYLYAESRDKIIRFNLSGNAPLASQQPEIVLDGLVTEKGHTSHSFAIGPDNALYVNSGSATNSCQVEDRSNSSPGEKPCQELTTRAGVWKYDALKLNQHFSATDRFITGVRNVVGLAFHPTAGLVLTIHGRDQLHENWGEKFTPEQSSELPAEVMVRPSAGEDYGWPFCYFDGPQNKYILAPEYGGDGKKTEGCENKAQPIAVYPAHWAPNAMVFYNGTLFPEKYRGGAFIAFHGSWNRVQQEGYNIVFQPFDESGKPSGDYEIFADGFAGHDKTPEGATHRPTGVTVGADGALFVSDDQGGRIYRIVPR
jgi:glucose/arabinose dehydrogenase